MAPPKTRRKRKTKKPLRRSLRGFRPDRIRLGELDQSRRDAIGLGLIATGAFFAFVFYFGWDGGRVGHILAQALRFVFGDVAYLAPLALFASGAALLVRRNEAPAPHRILGATLLLGALTLGYAGGTLGLGPHGGVHRDLFNPDQFMHRGGLVGDLLYWAISSLFSRAGAHIVFLFGFCAGLVVVTGVSVGSLLGRAKKLFGDARTSSRELAERLARERERAHEDAYGSASFYEEPDGEPQMTALHGGDDPHDTAFAAEREAIEADDEADPLAHVEREVESAERRVEAAAGEPDGPPTEELELTPQGNRRSAITESEEIDYRLPATSALRQSSGGQAPDASNQEQVAKLLVETLGHFGIEAQIVGRVTGPRVTRHELRLAPGPKVSKGTQLKDDIAYALASTDIRILAPIPGKQAVGVEVPNKRHRMVYLGDIFRQQIGGEGRGKSTAGGSGSPLSVWLGKDIAGNAVWTDLAKMPHLLVAGTTGSGKSGCVNTMLSSILLRSTPNEVRMVLV